MHFTSNAASMEFVAFTQFAIECKEFYFFLVFCVICLQLTEVDWIWIFFGCEWMHACVAVNQSMFFERLSSVKRSKYLQWRKKRHWHLTMGIKKLDGVRLVKFYMLDRRFLTLSTIRIKYLRYRLPFYNFENGQRHVDSFLFRRQ